MSCRGFFKGRREKGEKKKNGIAVLLPPLPRFHLLSSLRRHAPGGNAACRRWAAAAAVAAPRSEQQQQKSLPPSSDRFLFSISLRLDRCEHRLSRASASPSKKKTPLSYQLRDDLVDAPPLLLPRHPLRQLELRRRHDRLAHRRRRQEDVALPDDGRGGAEFAGDDRGAVDVDGAVDLAAGDVAGEDLEEGGLFVVGGVVEEERRRRRRKKRGRG